MVVKAKAARGSGDQFLVSRGAKWSGGVLVVVAMKSFHPASEIPPYRDGGCPDLLHSRCGTAVIP